MPGKFGNCFATMKSGATVALKRKSGLKDKELGAAIGWLAREDKIEFEQQEEELYIYLCVNVYIG